MPKCHKCPIVAECRNIKLAKKNEKGEVTERACPLLFTFFQSWALTQAHSELFKSKVEEVKEVG